MYGLSRPLTPAELTQFQSLIASRIAPFATVAGVRDAAGTSRFPAVAYVDLVFVADSPAPSMGGSLSIPATPAAQATLILADGPGAGGKGTRGFGTWL